MGSCSCCGSSIPEGQGVCSMCYGDIAYGSDGYYEEWARNEDSRQEQEVIRESAIESDLPF